MPLKFSQEKAENDRSRNPDVSMQPNVLSAAELPYRVNHAITPRPSYQPFPKASSSTATPSASTSNYNIPYRQRLVAAALGTSEDPHSSNDSSSAPSSNAVSSGVGTSSATSSATSSSSPHISKGKGKDTTTASPVISAPWTIQNVPSAPVQAAETTEFDPDTSYFELLMDVKADTLPAPGPSYFERRRAIWQTAPPNPPAPSSPSPSRVKLEALLSQPGAVESEEVWRAGLKNVWKGLVGGNQLRKRLPLAIVLKILQAGWLRDGTWPDGMVAPPWDHPVQTPPPPTTPDDPSHPQLPGQTQAQFQAQQQRRAHEQEAFAAALHARASAEQAGGTAQMMHMQAYAMLGMTGGIPPGYSPSSGDAPEEGYYIQYAYGDATPSPGGETVPGYEGQRQDRSPEYKGERQSIGEREEGPPQTPVRQGQDIDSEMDTEDEAEEEDAGAGIRMEGIVPTGDGRHEGG